MKKFLFIASALAIVAGCAKVTTVDTGEPQEIAFEAYTNVSTKGPIPDAVFPTDWNMLVHALYDGVSTGKEYFGAAGVVFAKSGDNWAANPAEYWPTTGTLTFNAIAPVAPTSDVVSLTAVSPDTDFFDYDGSSANVTSVKAVMGDNTTTQTDVLVARTKESAKTSSAVSVVFDHALAQVAVKAGVDDEGLDITVKSITLKGSYQSGTLSADPDAGAKVTFTWSNQGSQNDISIYNKPGNSTTLPTTPAEIVDAKGVLVVPNTVGEGVELELVYDVTYNGERMNDVTANIPLKSDSATSWVAGTKYTYTLTFTSPQKILISPSVEDWAEEEVDVPGL